MKRILFYKERFYPKELLTTLLQICNVEKKMRNFRDYWSPSVNYSLFK